MTTTYIDNVEEPIPSGGSNLYTAGTIAYAKIDYATVYNTSTSNVELDVEITKSGSSAAQYIKSIVPAESQIILYEIINRTLKTGDILKLTPSVADVINASIGIREVV